MTPARRTSTVVTALATAAFGFGMVQSFVSPLLPALQREYGIDEAAVAWLMTIFLLSASVVTPVAGRLGDMFGRARVLRWTMCAFSVGAVLAALAPDYTMMLVARCVQGAGGAVFPLAYGVIRERLSHRGIAGGIGLISSMSAIGSGTGAVIAGPIVGAWGAHAVFLVAAAAVLLAAVFVWAAVPVAGRSSPSRIDVGGASLLLVWLSSLLVLISRPSLWSDLPPVAVALLALTVTGFSAWLVVERRVAHPIVNLRLMASPPVLLSNLLAVLFGFLLFANMVTVPAFVQVPAATGSGFSATVGESALYVLPQTAMFLVISLLAGPMDRRLGVRMNILLGTVLTFGGQLMLFLAHGAPIGVLSSSAVTGVGIGLIYSHLATLVVRIVPDSETASASGMNTNVRNIGGSVGAQASAALVAANGVAAGYPGVFLLCTIVAACAIPIAVGIAWVASAGRPAD